MSGAKPKKRRSGKSLCSLPAGPVFAYAGPFSISKALNIKGKKTAVAKELGKAMAEKLIAMGISKVVFDRSGYLYHGRVKALADGAREKGLVF